MKLINLNGSENLKSDEMMCLLLMLICLRIGYKPEEIEAAVTNYQRNKKSLA